MVIIGGGEQTGVVGTALAAPLAVRVSDDAGNPVAGQLVTFHVTTGGGSAFAGTGLTNAEGVVQDHWILGTVAGAPQRLEARAVDPSTGAALASAPFQATAIAGAAATIDKVSGDATQAVVGTAVAEVPRVRVVDRYGNPVAGVAVTFAIASGGGTLSGVNATTDATGSAAVGSWTLGTAAGPNTATASSTGIPAGATFTATGTAAAAAKLAIVQPAADAHPTLAFTQQPVVRAEDAFGNPATGPIGAVSIAVSGGTTLLGTTSVIPVSGVATFANVGVNGPVGTYTLTYSATLDGVARLVSQPIDVTAGAPGKYVVTAGSSSLTVGAPVTITAQLTDVSGAAVAAAGETVTWSVSSGQSGAFSAPSSMTNASGVATVTFTPATTLASPTTTLTATEGGGRTGSAAFPVTPDAAAMLAFTTEPVDGEYLITLPTVAVTVRDRFGNLVTTDSRQVTIALGTNPASATLGGTRTVATIDGAATFGDLTVNRGASGYTLAASAPGLASAQSRAFIIAATGVVSSTMPDAIYDLFVSETSVYVPTLQFVYKVPTVGGAKTITGACDCNGSAQTVIVGDATTAYYVDVARTFTELYIYRLPFTAASQQRIYVTDTKFSAGLVQFAFDSTYLYYSVTGHTGVPGSPVDTGTFRLGPSDAARLKLLPGARQFAVADRQLYYFEGTEVRRMSIDGGSSTPVITGVAIPSVVSPIVIGEAIYWVENDAAAHTYAIRSALLSGGTATTRASGGGSIDEIVADGASVYARGSSGGTSSITKFDLTTFAPSTIVSGTSAIFSIALDAESVYWARPNVVLKAQK
jgi:hypothetical protein